MKNTLKHLEPEIGNLNPLQTETLFIRAAMIANRRPITARILTTEEAFAITPADLLLGRATGTALKNVDQRFWKEESEAAEQATLVKGKLEAIAKAWWNIWSERSFPLLLPRRRWAEKHRNLQVGDVVHLKYDSKFSKTRYRLGRIVETHPDKQGIVRTVSVSLRDRHGVASEPPNDCRTSWQILKVGVQRLVVVLPAEEQQDVPIPSKHTPRKHKQQARHEMLTRAAARQARQGSSSLRGTVD